jgi:integrase
MIPPLDGIAGMRTSSRLKVSGVTVGGGTSDPARGGAFTQTADDAQLPEDVLETFFRRLLESGYSRGTVETYLGGVMAFWRFAAAKRLVPPRFAYEAPLWIRHDNRRGRPGPGGEHWRMSLQTVWSTVRDHARAVGVAGTPHHLRHLKASTLLNRGASMSEVQDVLGHA